MAIELLSFLGLCAAGGMLIIAILINDSINDKRPPGSG
jgi:hypothetical protein